MYVARRTVPVPPTPMRTHRIHATLWLVQQCHDELPVRPVGASLAWLTHAGLTLLRLAPARATGA